MSQMQHDGMQVIENDKLCTLPEDRKEDAFSYSEQVSQIRETAQKQFSLGYQEPEPSDLQSERISPKKDDIDEQLALEQTQLHNLQESGAISHEGRDTDDNHIKITIELGDGKHEDIIVEAGQEDSAPELSKQFCHKYGYDRAVENALTDRIKENIEKIKDERKKKQMQALNDNLLPHRIPSSKDQPQDKDIDLEVIPEKDMYAEVSNAKIFGQPVHDVSNINSNFEEQMYFDSKKASNTFQNDILVQENQQEFIEYPKQPTDIIYRSSQNTDQLAPSDMNQDSQKTIAKGFKQLARTGLQELRINPHSPALSVPVNNSNLPNTIFNSNSRTPQGQTSNRAKWAPSSSRSKPSSRFNDEHCNPQKSDHGNNEINQSIINVGIQTAQNARFDQNQMNQLIQYQQAHEAMTGMFKQESPQFIHIKPQWLQSSNNQTISDQQVNVSTVQGVIEESAMESKYLKDQNGTILSTQSPTVEGISSNQTRNMKVQACKSQDHLSRKMQSKSPPATDLRQINERKTSIKQNMFIQNHIYGDQFDSIQNDDSTGVYQQILAQSEYGYVAKTGKWKEKSTNKNDIERIQKNAFNFGEKEPSDLEHVQSDRRQRRKKAQSIDLKSSKKLKYDSDIRDKPYVNQISQILASRSTKRAMPNNDFTKGKSKSIHDRLFLQHTKGKVLYQLMQQTERQRSSSNNSKSVQKQKQKKQLQKFLSSNRGGNKKNVQDPQIQQLENFENQQFENQNLNTICMVDNQQNMVGQVFDNQMQIPGHNKSKSVFLFRTLHPVEQSGDLNFQNIETFNNQPVSIDLHQAMTNNQMGQVIAPQNHHKFQTIQALPDEKEMQEFLTPVQNCQQMSTIGGISEVIRMQVSGIDARDRYKTTAQNEFTGLHGDSQTNKNQAFSQQPHFGDEDTNPESENFSVAQENSELFVGTNFPQKPGLISPAKFSNIGEKLYEKGIIRNMQRQQFLNEMMRIKQVEEMNEATFKPVTSSRQMQKRASCGQDLAQFQDFQNQTFDINKQRMVIREGHPVMVNAQKKFKMDKQEQEQLGRRLIQYGQQLQMRKAAAMQMKERQEIEACDFRPRINQKSVEIVNQRSGSRPRPKQKSTQIAHSGQKIYGNSHLRMFDIDSKSMKTQKSQKRIDSPRQTMLNQMNIEQGFSEIKQNSKSMVEMNVMSSDNVISPSMSFIENENEIPDIKPPTYIKQFNFQQNSENDMCVQQSQLNQNMEQMSNIDDELDDDASQHAYQPISKHEALYNDAKTRSFRQKEIYSRCINNQCTFKPERITQKSSLSRKVIKEVQDEVKEKITLQKLQDLAMIATMSANPSVRNENQTTSRQCLQFFNQNMRGYSQNESVLGAPKREVITLNDVPLGNHEPMTVSELFRNKSHDNRLRNAIDDWQTQVCNNQLSPKLNNSRLMYLNQASNEKKWKQQPVFKRLAEQALVLQNFQKEMQQKKKKLESSRDPITGQRFFKPIIKRHQSQGRRMQPHQVGQNLYINHSVTQQKIKCMRKDEINKLKEQRKFFSRANSKSDRIIINARKQKLAEIFDRIDHDGDGEISSNKIDISRLSEKMVRIFQPLFNELQILMQPLDKEEFVDAGMRLYDCLSQNEKNTILKFDKKQDPVDHELQKCTFAPSINFSNVDSKVYNIIKKNSTTSSAQQIKERYSKNQRLNKFLTKQQQSEISNQSHAQSKSWRRREENMQQIPSYNELSLNIKDSYFSTNRQSTKDHNSRQVVSIPIESKMQSSRQSESHNFNLKERSKDKPIVLNDQVADKQLIKSVHQKLCDIQNQSKQSSLMSNQYSKANSEVSKHHSSIMSAENAKASQHSRHQSIQEELEFNADREVQMLNFPVDSIIEQTAKPGSSLSIMDIAPRTISRHGSSIVSQGSSQSIPKPFNHLRVPNMEVQPPAIIAQGDSEKRGSIPDGAGDAQARQKQGMFNGMTQSPFKIQPQMTQLAAGSYSNDAHSSISQISANTQAENGHKDSIGVEQISPVRDHDEIAANTFKYTPLTPSMITNPYIHHNVRRSSQTKKTRQETVSENQTIQPKFESGGALEQLHRKQMMSVQNQKNEEALQTQSMN